LKNIEIHVEEQETIQKDTNEKEEEQNTHSEEHGYQTSKSAKTLFRSYVNIWRRRGALYDNPYAFETVTAENELNLL
jgi:hypothetical protein